MYLHFIIEIASIVFLVTLILIWQVWSSWRKIYQSSIFIFAKSYILQIQFERIFDNISNDLPLIERILAIDCNNHPI